MVFLNLEDKKEEMEELRLTSLRHQGKGGGLRVRTKPVGCSKVLYVY